MVKIYTEMNCKTYILKRLFDYITSESQKILKSMAVLLAFIGTMFAGFCPDADCVAAGYQVGCDVVSGCISHADFSTYENCNDLYNSTGTLENMQLDLDQDDLGGVQAGWFCTNNPAASSYVTNNNDIDDDCFCSANDSTCYDDCDTCNGILTTNTIEVCIGG